MTNINKPPQSVEEKSIKNLIDQIITDSVNYPSSHTYKQLLDLETRVREDEWKKHIQTCQCGKCVNYKRINQLSQEEK